MSLSVASHYCGGKLVKQAITFGEENLSCGMVAEENKFCGASAPFNQLKKIPCCKDQQVFWDVEDRYNPQVKGELYALPIIQNPSSHITGFGAGKLIVRPTIKKPDPPGSSLLILNQVFRL